jgi:hypothetical protein
MPIWKGHCIGRRVTLIMLAIGSIAGMTMGSRAQAETTYTPSVRFSQRYDSNVFYSPKEFIPPGTQTWDLVTTLGADVKVLNKSRLGDTELRVGVNGNAYAYNSDLAYGSAHVFAASDLTDWMNELLPGLKLRISDAFQYTPEPPAFLTGGKPEQSDTFARGIQAFRANTYSNNFSVDGGYSFSRSVGLRANYTNSIRRIGSRFVTTPTTTGQFAYFDTTVHSFTTGPTYTFEGGDTLFLRYNYVTADSSTTTGVATSIKFTAHSIQPEYVTPIVRGWMATISGGATVIEQVENRAFISGRFALINDFDRQTRVSIAVSRQASPAYFGTGGAFISNVAQLYVSHGFTRLVRLTVSGNYAYNETVPVKTFTIKTIAGSAVLDYSLTRSTTVSLSQEYSHYNYTGVSPFDRYATMLTLTTEWK